MKELIEYIARSLVDDPTQVEVSYQRHGDYVKYQLQVAQEDMGRVIGKNGRVANAMRTLVEVAVAQKGKQAKLDIVEPR
ncbi:MAG: KH domain-containing protein [Anaerolineales bacterium]